MPKCRDPEHGYGAWPGSAEYLARLDADFVIVEAGSAQGQAYRLALIGGSCPCDGAISGFLDGRSRGLEDLSAPGLR